MQTYSTGDLLPTSLFNFVWRYLKNRKLFLLGFLVIALIWAIDMSLSPYLLKVIIDTVVRFPTDQTKMLAAMLIPATLYVSMTVIMNLTFRWHDYLNLRLYPEIYAEIDKDMFSYLMHHSYTFFQNHFAGSLTRKIFDMAQSVERIISTIKVAVVPRIIALIISSAVLFTVVQPIFGIILFAWTIIFVYISYIVAIKSERIAREHAEESAKLGGVMTDSVSNVISTKLFANLTNEIAYLDKYINLLVKIERKLLWKNLTANFIQGFFVTLLLGSMLTALIYGRIHGTISPGDFALVLTLSISFVMSLEDIRQRMLEFTKVVGTCNQALSFIKIPHEITDAPNAFPITIKNGEIKFENVSFKHENANSILFNRLNIRINPGEKVGLVGYSGGGKSTFIKLILRLIDLQSGRIFIDNQDVKEVTKHSLRKQIGTIPQEPDLFHRTIMENIRFAKPDASDEEVISAAKKARCHEFILDLPEQYQSLVGERGIKLSGGQKQRIAIARAFLKNAPILLLDEATSSLDSITENYIQESLHAVMQNRTTLVIAHRLSTLKDMDRILVFDSGKIVEDGSLDTLLQNKNGHFYKLWNMQAKGFIPTINENPSNALLPNHDVLTNNIINIAGEKGKAWIDSLPFIIHELCKKWKLENVTPVDNMTYNYVAKVTSPTNIPLILKISSDIKSFMYEKEALQYFNSDASIQVIDYNEEYSAMLLQQAIPGTSLKYYYPAQVEFVVECYADTILKLHAQQLPPPHQFPHISDWLKSIDLADPKRLPEQLLKKAIQIKNDLLNSLGQDILLHGDLHQDNILKNGNSWLAIDPKGIMGEAEFEVAAFDFIHSSEMNNESNVKKLFESRMNLLAEKSNLNPQRIKDWVFVRLILSAAWSIEDNGDPAWALKLANILF